MAAKWRERGGGGGGERESRQTDRQTLWYE